MMILINVYFAAVLMVETVVPTRRLISFVCMFSPAGRLYRVPYEDRARRSR